MARRDPARRCRPAAAVLIAVELNIVTATGPDEAPLNALAYLPG